MTSILNTIAEYTVHRIAEAKKTTPLSEMKAKALSLNCRTGFPFEQALSTDEISFICECKKASPSKGLIAPDFPYLSIAREYETAGASCISVLTEPHWFLGENRYLSEISATVSIPCLRKDFVVDEYMIYEAKTLGASAVLLICSLLSTERLTEYISICDTLGLSALVEAHNETEILSALTAGARIIGVNNRNLSDFTVDIANSSKLRSLVPPSVLFVAESGIQNAADIKALKDNHVNAVLIGETLMRAADKKAMLHSLRGAKPPEESNKTKIKICGLTREVDISYANELKPDYVGFVFARKSRRYVSPERAGQLKSLLDDHILATGVFANEPLPSVLALADAGIIDVIQLHGAEDEAYISALQNRTDKPIIQAFCINSSQDTAQAMRSTADYILFDSGKGGTGKAFDWPLISEIKRPYFLAGGLDCFNITRAITSLQPFAVDVSSGVETDGYKDYHKMKTFIQAVRQNYSADGQQNGGIS